MLRTQEDMYYAHCLDKLHRIIPAEEYRSVLSQDKSELEPDFLGFINVYDSLSKLIPKGSIVVDFGCYLAAQSYFFVSNEMYIGVDVVNMKRFTPPNAVHYVMSIQDFIQKEVPKLFEEHDEYKFCAICSYVPDFPATKLVRETFNNVFCYYPCNEIYGEIPKLVKGQVC